MFLQVDKSWKEIMRKVNRLPNALRAATQPGRSFKLFVTTKTLSFRLSGYIQGLTDLSTLLSKCCHTVEFVTLEQKLNSVHTLPSQIESQKLP